MDTARDEAGDVRHVGHHDGADPVGRGANAREIDHARVRARANDDQLRLALIGQPIELVIVDPFIVLAHAVRDDRIELTGEVQRVPVRQVAAVGEVHAEDRVARA